MAPTNFFDLPGELRNYIYNLVFGDTEMVIGVDQDGMGEQGYKQGDALRLACKQIRNETESHESPSIDKLVIKPRCQQTTYGGSVIDVLFDFDKWLNAGPASRLSRPMGVELHAGEIDIVHLNSVPAWQAEIARIVGNIPSKAVDTWGFKLIVALKLTAPPITGLELRIPIPGDKKLKASVERAMRSLKRETGELMATEWEHLGPAELATERKEIWKALHAAQEQLKVRLFYMYYL